MGDVGALVKKPNFALKCLELLIACISIGVVIDGYPVADSLMKTATIYGTQIGFIMISIIIIMSFLMDTPLHKTILLIIGGVGCVMWVTTGALIVDNYLNSKWTIGGFTFKYEDRLLVSGVFGLINAMVYLVDTALTFKN